MIFKAPAPQTQHLPIPLATTAAWEVIPPLAVKIPLAMFIPSKSSGDVSILTKILWANFLASSAKKTIYPEAAPGDAGNPLATNLAVFKASGVKIGCNNSSNLFGSILLRAVFSSIFPSLNKSQAI